MGNPIKRKKLRKIEASKKLKELEQKLPNALVFTEEKKAVKEVLKEQVKEEVELVEVKEEVPVVEVKEEEKTSKKKKSLQDN